MEVRIKQKTSYSNYVFNVLRVQIAVNIILKVDKNV